MSDLLARLFGVWGLVGGLFLLWIAYKTGFHLLIFLALAIMVALSYRGE